jgi:hypothetical protein
MAKHIAKVKKFRKATKGRKATKARKATRARKVTRARSGKVSTYSNAQKALNSVQAVWGEIGTDKTGIDQAKLIAFLKKWADKVANKEIHFVALNAPFMRRSSTPPV